MLFGSTFLVLPGVGHLIILGALASTLFNAAAGAVVGSAIGAVGGALSSIGLPKDTVIKYERDLKAGKFMLLAHGSAAEIACADQVLRSLGTHAIDQHGAVSA